MAFNQAAVGKSFLVSIALTMDGFDTNTPPADEDFTVLGAVRDLNYGTEWETADTTARGTGNVSTSLVTFANQNIEMSGVFLLNDAFQREVELHIETPPAEMNGQPYAWVRIYEPRVNGAGETIDIASTLQSFRKGAPHAGEVTYDLNAGAQNTPVRTAVPAAS